MGIIVREFRIEDILDMIEIWNEVVEEGIAFPQMECLNEETGITFFEEQFFTGVAVEEETGKLVGLYILHPNNIGRWDIFPMPAMQWQGESGVRKSVSC